MRLKDIFHCFHLSSYQDYYYYYYYYGQCSLHSPICKIRFIVPSVNMVCVKHSRLR